MAQCGGSRHMPYKWAILFEMLWLLVTIGDTTGYTIPQPKASALRPRGFRISIPDEEGVSFVAFHGNINREFRGTEAGEYHGEIRQAANNEWVFQNNRYELQSGDVLYYWMYVQYNRVRYRIDNAKFVYPDDFDTDGSSPITSRPRPVTPEEYTEDEPSTTTARATTGRSTQRTTTTARTTPDRPVTPRTTTTQSTSTTAAPDTCMRSITIVRNEPVDCKGKLIFEEQFLDDVSERWKPDKRMSLDTEDAEFVLYQSYPDIWNVSNGNLYVFPKLLTDIADFTEDRLRSGEIDLGSECTFVRDYEQECQRKAEFARILPPVVSTKLTTKKTFSFKYGKVEIRAKLPKGDWMFPQLLLEPVDNSYYGVTGYANGQIRVAFIRGNSQLDTRESTQIDGHRLSGGVVIVSGEAQRDTWLKSTLQENHFADEFHTYTLTWTDQRISLGVDGSNYAIINANFKDLSSAQNIPHQPQWRKGNAVAPFDREFYISLGVGVGGISDFPDGSRTGQSQLVKPWENTSPKAELRFWSSKDTWKQTWNSDSSGLIVDYVRVWSI